MLSSQPSKADARRVLRANRNRQTDKDALSQAICARLTSLPAYQSADVVMAYVHARSEVRTEILLNDLLARRKTAAIPYCQGDELIPWRLTAFSELSPGAFGIMEPRDELRGEAQRAVAPGEIDLVVVPGLAFDRLGNRLGSGRGFYDRLLPRLHSDAIKVGLAYECQIVSELPTESHDVRMDLVVTETSCIDVR